MLVSIFLVILSAHFARVLAGNLYRAMPALLASREQLAKMLGKTTVMKTPQLDAEGKANGEWDDTVVPNLAAITAFERCKFYCHILLAS